MPSKQLKLKEQMVIKNYFGIKCSEKKLVDIAKELKTSKQVVSVIKKRALGKLKEYILKEKRKEIRKWKRYLIQFTFYFIVLWQYLYVCLYILVYYLINTINVEQ